MSTPSPEEVERVVVGFVRALRSAGVEVPVGSTVVFAEALAALGVEHSSSVYWAGRATLVPGPDDRAAYDRVFRTYWLGDPGPTSPPARSVPITIALDDEAADPPLSDGNPADDVADDGEVVTIRFSRTEILRHKDFAEYSAEELAEAQRLMATMRVAGAPRRSRRLVPSTSDRGRLDARRTVRTALRSDGELVRRMHRRPSTRPRRVVLLCDISGSMEPYSRALLRFVQAAVAGRTKVEAFTLGTRLTRLTRELSGRDPDAALSLAAAAVEDWSGGTRLGESLRHFNDEWGVRGMARGAVVVILSDGWDRGDPSELGVEMARLRRVAHRVVWVNPLKASPGYQPLAQGMAAALPHVDEFIEGHSLDALDDLARIITRA